MGLFGGWFDLSVLQLSLGSNAINNFLELSLVVEQLLSVPVRIQLSLQRQPIFLLRPIYDTEFLSAIERELIFLNPILDLVSRTIEYNVNLLQPKP